MRERMVVRSYFMASSCARCCGDYAPLKGTRNERNALSGKAQHVRRGKTCKGRWDKAQRSDDARDFLETPGIYRNCTRPHLGEEYLWDQTPHICKVCGTVSDIPPDHVWSL